MYKWTFDKGRNCKYVMPSFTLTAVGFMYCRIRKTSVQKGSVDNRMSASDCYVQYFS